MWSCHLTLLTSLLQDVCRAICWVKPSLQKTWERSSLVSDREDTVLSQREWEWLMTEPIWFIYQGSNTSYTFFFMCKNLNNRSSMMCSHWTYVKTFVFTNQNWIHYMLSKGEIECLISCDYQNSGCFLFCFVFLYLSWITVLPWYFITYGLSNKSNDR